MATWDFSGAPKYTNGTFSVSVRVDGFLPNPYQLVYRVQLTDNTNKVILGGVTNDPRFTTRDFTNPILNLNLSQQIGVPLDKIKSIDIAMTNPAERPSGATGQRRALLNLLHWEPSGATNQIYTGILSLNPLTGMYDNPITRPKVPSTTQTNPVFVTTTVTGGGMASDSGGGTVTPVTTVSPYQNFRLHIQRSDGQSKYFVIDGKAANTVSAALNSVARTVGIVILPDSDFWNFPADSTIQDIYDFINKATGNTVIPPPIPPTIPPSTPPPVTNFSFGNIFSYIVGGGIATAFLTSIVKRRRSKRRGT